MATTSFSPRFIRANIIFKYEGTPYTAGQHLINSYGVPGFNWSLFDPMKTVGARVDVTIQIPAPEAWDFKCEAVLSCEQTGTSTLLGMNFLINDSDKARLDSIVSAVGQLPEFSRKFPRIGFDPTIPIFPSRAILRFYFGKEDSAIACDIENISPSGLQVATDDPRAAAIFPDTTVRINLQPRGSFVRPVQLNASVKRIVLSTEPATGNLVRHFGMAITSISNDTKFVFADWLKQIILLARG